MKLQTSMKEFEEYAQKLIHKHHIPGVGIGMECNGERIYEQGFGFRNKEEGLLVTPDTVFGIASMTKSFTCVAIMQLQEAGKLTVHDPVITYLPEFTLPNPEYTKQITIHHFMTHTSGMPPLSTHVYARKRSVDQDPSAKDYGLNLVDNQGEPIDTYEEMMEYIGNIEFELLGAPGTEFSYTNDTYGLLGAIISRVSGMSYEEYVVKHILQPCKMTNSFFDLTELDKKDNVTMLYATRKSAEGVDVYAAPKWWDAPAMRAAGYLKSTVNDILKYTQIFVNKGVVDGQQILTEESVKQMTFPHVEFEPGKYYGYGLRVTPDYGGVTLIEHGGGLKAVSSLMCMIPEKGITGVVLTNLSGVPAGKILKGAVHTPLDKPIEFSNHEFTDYNVSEEELQEYAGTYRSGEGMEVTFAVEANQLVIVSKDTNQSLRSIGKALFTYPTEDGFIRFLRDSNGEVNRVFYQSRQIYKIK